MTLKPVVFRHADEQQVAIAGEPFVGDEQQFAGGQEILLFATQDGVAQVAEGDAQPSIVEHDGHVGLQPVAMPGVALLHTERTDIVDMVGGLDDIETMMAEPGTILPEPVDHAGEGGEVDDACRGHLDACLEQQAHHALLLLPVAQLAGEKKTVARLAQRHPAGDGAVGGVLVDAVFESEGEDRLAGDGRLSG